MSYTKFDYGTAATGIVEAMAPNGTAKVTFTVKNTGRVDGDEVAQVYFRHVKSTVPQPKEALCGFARVHLKAGESGNVAVEVPPNGCATGTRPRSNMLWSRGNMNSSSARRRMTSG